jgi:tRNA A37 threonylcarbamoyladenosine modification protein TsaB
VAPFAKPTHRLSPESSRLPRVDDLFHVGLERYRSGQRDDLHSIEPLYLRSSSAEEKWKSLGRSIE